MTGPVFEAVTFGGHEGEVFTVSSESPALSCELVLRSVTTWGPEPAAGGRRPFTLLFHGPLEPVLPQRIYRFDHPALGPFDIFIVPVGPDQQAMQYEAIFT